MQEKRFGEGNSGSPSLLGFRNSDKSGQVTIFIIVAVLVVAGIVLYFVLNSDSSETEQSVSGDQEIQSPEGFLRSCVEDNVFALMRDLRDKGGYLEPSSALRSSEVPFLSRDVAYLCYANSLDKECVVQEPSVVGRMEIELSSAVPPIISECAGEMRDAYSNQGYDVLGGSFEEGVEVDLVEDSLELDFNITSMTLEKTNETRKFDGDMDLSFVSDLYTLGSAADYIVGEESSKEDYDSREFVLFYPQYEVIKNKTFDNTELYRIRGRGSDLEFKFAVRELT